MWQKRNNGKNLTEAKRVGEKDNDTAKEHYCRHLKLNDLLALLDYFKLKGALSSEKCNI